MPLLINLRHLEKKPLELRGELAATELELDGIDELIHVTQPLKHDLVAQLLGRDVLVQGRLQLGLQCECARCLKPFVKQLELEHWAAHLPLEGEDQVVIKNDCVDLTPFLREDILLQFPQHPLCEPECRGLQQQAPPAGGGVEQSANSASAWAALDKLKL